MTEFFASGGSARIYRCIVTADSTLTGDGSEQITVQVPANAATAKAGLNAGMGSAASNTASVLYDPTSPYLALSTTPATLSDSSSAAFTVTFRFSENVNGFGDNGRPSNITPDSEVIPDIQVQNGTVGAVTVLGRESQTKPGGARASSFQATVTPSAGNAQTDVRVFVSAGAVEDAARNENPRSDVLNGSPTAVTLSLSPDSAVETAAATTVTVTASLNADALPTATVVTVSQTGGTATSGTDYAAISNLTVTIAAEQTSGTGTLSFDPTDDSLVEGDETVILTAAATGLTSGTATLTITDDDAETTGVTLSLNPTSVAETAAATTVTVTAALNGGARSSATEVTVSQTAGTATSGTDYAAISNLTVTIAAEQTSGTATFTIDPTEDSLSEGDETVIFSASASGLTSGTATLTITDDTAAPVAITLSLNLNSVRESTASTSIQVTASLANPAVSQTELSVSVTGGTATAGADYVAVAPVSLTIAAGQTSGTAQLPFEPIDDTAAEGDETVIFTASAAGLTAGTATLTITDNDQSETFREERSPAITLWTDRLAYRSDDEIHLYLDIDPHGDDREYTLFIYRESIQTGDRLYLARRSRSMALRDEVTDWHGRGAEEHEARPLARIESEPIWAGQVPRTGLWHFVVELRDPDATKVITRAYAKFSVPSATVLLVRRGFERVVESDLHLTNDWTHMLGGRLVVKPGATLSLEAGTFVLASDPTAEIVIEPGARIMALGQRVAPVVLTCSQPLGERFPGCWKGLQVLGRAPVRDRKNALPNARLQTASDPAEVDPHDSSGVLRYLRVEFAAAGSAPDAPTAALDLHGVGRGTLIDHVQVHASLGDGFAFHGGTAHCSYFVASEVRNDSLLWNRGWRGSAQHLYVQQGSQASSAVRGSAAQAAMDSPAPTLYNATLVGGYDIGVSGGVPGNFRSISPGILLEGEAAVSARNVLATGFAGFALDGSVASFARGRSSFSHSLLTNSGYLHSSQVRGLFAPYVQFVKHSPKLLNVRYAANPDPRPRSGSAALRLGNAEVPPFDPWFSHSAHYVGAFGKENWLEEWTFFGPEQDYEVPVD